MFQNKACSHWIFPKTLCGHWRMPAIKEPPASGVCESGTRKVTNKVWQVPLWKHKEQVRCYIQPTKFSQSLSSFTLSPIQWLCHIWLSNNCPQTVQWIGNHMQNSPWEIGQEIGDSDIKLPLGAWVSEVPRFRKEKLKAKPFGNEMTRRSHVARSAVQTPTGQGEGSVETQNFLSPKLGGPTSQKFSNSKTPNKIDFFASDLHLPSNFPDQGVGVTQRHTSQTDTYWQY